MHPRQFSSYPLKTTLEGQGLLHSTPQMGCSVGTGTTALRDQVLNKPVLHCTHNKLLTANPAKFRRPGHVGEHFNRTLRSVTQKAFISPLDYTSGVDVTLDWKYAYVLHVTVL